MVKTTGSLLQLSEYQETSVIVQWCTPDHGLIRTIAKGARRPRSAFAGKLDLFFKSELEFIPSRRSTLHTLREVAILEPRFGLRHSYLQTLAASYFARLIDLVAEDGTPIIELADLTERGLDYLTTQRPNLRAVTHFESEAAKILGLGDRGLQGIGELYGRIPAIRKELFHLLSE